MFTNTNLKFPHGAMLTSTMLREIYNYPREFFTLLYKNYGDGIICGLDYFIQDKNLFLNSGVIHFDGDFYFLSQDLNMSALAEKNNLETDKQYYICLSRLSNVQEACLTENTLAVTFSETKISPVLGRFYFSKYDNFNLPKLAKGSKPFKDIFKPSVLNLADVPFAIKNGDTFHPMLFRLVKEFLTGKEDKTPFDYAILTQLQNDDVISTQTINSYIAEEVDGKSKFADRADLFKTFCDCLVNSKFSLPVLNAEEIDDTPKTKEVYSGCGRML